jgi:hypothetical protein
VSFAYSCHHLTDIRAFCSRQVSKTPLAWRKHTANPSLSSKRIHTARTSRLLVYHSTRASQLQQKQVPKCMFVRLVSQPTDHGTPVACRAWCNTFSVLQCSVTFTAVIRVSNENKCRYNYINFELHRFDTTDRLRLQKRHFTYRWWHWGNKKWVRYATVWLKRFTETYQLIKRGVDEKIN